MKYILLFVIKLYWLLIPPNKRRKCIFKDSCSQKVFSIAQSRGFFPALKLFGFRYKNCRPGFDIYTDINSGKKKMILKTGEIVEEEKIAPRLL